MGAGIEIPDSTITAPSSIVAPFVGAGIEMLDRHGKKMVDTVAPFVGAGIEIVPAGHALAVPSSRTLRGCGD